MAKLISFGDTQVAECFKPIFDSINVIHYYDNLVRELDKDSVLVFGGGADISPSLYGEVPSIRTLASEDIRGRDLEEARAFNYARENQIPMLGICRGAQLICALSGGKLIQHLNGHNQDHYVVTDKNERIKVTSTHHQAMWPFDTRHKLIAWSDVPRSTTYVLNDDTILRKVPVEAEIVYFKTTNALGIQGHPEYLSSSKSFVDYCHSLVKEYLL